MYITRNSLWNKLVHLAGIQRAAALRYVESRQFVDFDILLNISEKIFIEDFCAGRSNDEIQRQINA